MIHSQTCYHLDHLCNTPIDFLMFLNNYCCTPLDCASVSKQLDLALTTWELI